MDNEAGGVEARVVAIARRLGDVDALRFPARPSDRNRRRQISLTGPGGRQFTLTVSVRPREVLALTADGSAYAVVGDSDGDENHVIRIRAATGQGVRVVHESSPVSPGVRALGDGLVWIGRDDSQRPHVALWWDHTRDHPVRLIEEDDRTRRLELRSVEGRTAVLGSRGPDRTRFWIISAGPGDAPECAPLTTGSSDVDAIAWRGDIVVLDRDRRFVRGRGDHFLDASAPAGFVAEHLQPVGESLFVVGRSLGRQAFWMPARGSAAVWIAPPAGTMLPSFDAAEESPVFLVSSPVHEPQVVHPRVAGEVSATSTRRADVQRLTARSEDGTSIPVTLFLPPGSEERPLVAHVYVAYGISLEGPFDPFSDDLLTRGVAIAFCHVRGGGENGPGWHRQAKGSHRYRPVEDLLACLEMLRRLPAIAADRVGLCAASAGGLTAAMACLRQPTWLRGVQLVHPFVDPLSALKDPDVNLATTDWAEFGDPRNEEQCDSHLRQLSPTAVLEHTLSRSLPLPRPWIRSASRDARADAEAIERFCDLYEAASIPIEPEQVVHRLTSGGHVGGDAGDSAHEENLLAHAWLLDLLGVGEIDCQHEPTVR